MQLVSKIIAALFLLGLLQSADAQLYVNNKFDYYVDSVGGNDANNGTSLVSAWQNLSKIPTATSNLQVCLVAGSSWAQALQIGAVTPVSNVHIVGCGAGAQPIIDGADAISSGNWTKTGGLTATYNTTAAVTFPNGQGLSNNFTPWINVFEDGIPMSSQTTQAAVDACSMPCYTTTSVVASTGTISIRASDGSNPASNGRTYSYTARPFSVQINGTGGVRVVNVHAKNNGSILGSIQLNGDGSQPYLGYSTLDNGSKHSAILGCGTSDNNTFNEAYYPASQNNATNMLVFFETVGSGNPCLSRYDTFNFSTATATANPATAIYGHTGSGSFGTVTYANAKVIVTGNLGFSGFSAANTSLLNITGGLITGAMGVTGADVPTVVDGLQFISGNTQGTRFAQINLGTIGTLTIQNSKSCLININQGAIRNYSSTANVSLTNFASWAGTSSFFRTHVFSDHAMNLTVNGSTYDGIANIGVYSLGTGSDETFAGDNNSYGHTNSWFLNNTDHVTLGSWKSAVTPQDANSNTVAVGNWACN